MIIGAGVLAFSRSRSHRCTFWRRRNARARNLPLDYRTALPPHRDTDAGALAEAPGCAFGDLKSTPQKPQAQARLVFTRGSIAWTHALRGLFSLNPETRVAAQVVDNAFVFRAFESQQDVQREVEGGFAGRDWRKVGVGETVPVELREQSRPLRFAGRRHSSERKSRGCPARRQTSAKLRLQGHSSRRTVCGRRSKRQR